LGEFLLSALVVIGDGEKEKIVSETNDPYKDVSCTEIASHLGKAWERMYEFYYSPKTHLFYNSTINKVAPSSFFIDGFADPDIDKKGYGHGMEDCSIFGGLMLSLFVDRYEVTKDDSLKEVALNAFKGMKLLATVHGSPGFVARGVCVEDGRSVCLTSSRDQYTHFVHGLWRYYHSPLCSENTKKEIRKLISAVADRMIRNVTPENGYDFLRADGSRDPRGICRMWNVNPHEAARLPMIYGAAWDICRDQKYFDLYRKYTPPAVEQSFSLASWPEVKIQRWMPTYTLLQMQSSLELLYALEPEGSLKKKIVDTMRIVAEMGAKRAVRVNGGEEKYLCACGEAALAQLMAEDYQFNEEQKKLLNKSVMVSDVNKVGACRTIHLAAAFWRARRLGIL